MLKPTPLSSEGRQIITCLLKNYEYITEEKSKNTEFSHIASVMDAALQIMQSCKTAIGRLYYNLLLSEYPHKDPARAKTAKREYEEITGKSRGERIYVYRKKESIDLFGYHFFSILDLRRDVDPDKLLHYIIGILRLNDEKSCPKDLVICDNFTRNTANSLAVTKLHNENQ